MPLVISNTSFASLPLRFLKYTPSVIDSLISGASHVSNVIIISFRFSRVICPPTGCKYTLYKPSCFCSINLLSLMSTFTPFLVYLTSSHSKSKPPLAFAASTCFLKHSMNPSSPNLSTIYLTLALPLFS